MDRSFHHDHPAMMVKQCNKIFIQRGKATIIKHDGGPHRVGGIGMDNMSLQVPVHKKSKRLCFRLNFMFYNIPIFLPYPILFVFCIR